MGSGSSKPQSAAPTPQIPDKKESPLKKKVSSKKFTSIRVGDSSSDDHDGDGNTAGKERAMSEGARAAMESGQVGATTKALDDPSLPSSSKTMPLEILLLTPKKPALRKESSYSGGIGGGVANDSIDRDGLPPDLSLPLPPALVGGASHPQCDQIGAFYEDSEGSEEDIDVVDSVLSPYASSPVKHGASAQHTTTGLDLANSLVYGGASSAPTFSLSKSHGCHSARSPPRGPMRPPGDAPPRSGRSSSSSARFFGLDAHMSSSTGAECIPQDFSDKDSRGPSELSSPVNNSNNTSPHTHHHQPALGSSLETNNSFGSAQSAPPGPVTGWIFRPPTSLPSSPRGDGVMSPDAVHSPTNSIIRNHHQTSSPTRSPNNNTGNNSNTSGAGLSYSQVGIDLPHDTSSSDASALLGNASPLNTGSAPFASSAQSGSGTFSIMSRHQSNNSMMLPEIPHTPKKRVSFDIVETSSRSPKSSPPMSPRTHSRRTASSGRATHSAVLVPQSLVNAGGALPELRSPKQHPSPK